MTQHEHDTPAPAADQETVEVTVTVPAHRVAQFHRFHERFLAMAGRWDARVGSEDLGGPRGRRRHGRCRARHAGAA